MPHQTVTLSSLIGQLHPNHKNTMTHRQRSRKEKAQFGDRLLKYSTAAGAAVALTNAADAGIATIDVSGWALQLSGLSDGGSFSVDLNGDSTNDFTFRGNRSGFTSVITTTEGAFTTTYSIRGSFTLSGAGANRAASNGFGSIRKFNPSSGVAGAFPAYGGVYFFTTNYGDSGENSDFNPAAGEQDSGFIGLSFEISGNTHYAWLEVLVSKDGGGRPFELSVLSGAYEDQAGVDIAAGAIPEPASVGVGLGLLALGAAGVRRMRGRD